MRSILKGRFFIYKRPNVSWVIPVLFAVTFFACKENEIYPEIPSLEFKSYSFRLEVTPDGQTDTSLLLVFGYKDGDGDIGLNAGDTFPPYNQVRDSFNNNTNLFYNNIHAHYYELKSGNWVRLIDPASNDTVPNEGRIENITPEGKHKAIRGTIEWQIPLPFYDEREDTIMLNIWIYDRALHQSNIIQTPVIVLP